VRVCCVLPDVAVEVHDRNGKQEVFQADVTSAEFFQSQQRGEQPAD